MKSHPAYVHVAVTGTKRAVKDVKWVAKPLHVASVTDDGNIIQVPEHISICTTITLSLAARFDFTFLA